MKEYNGPERREHRRIDINFVVSYRIKEVSPDFDLSQTKNLSQGGMLLTTNKKFQKGLQLSMILRFPLIPQKIEITGVVIDSKEVVRDIIYETRIRFIDVNREFFSKLGEFIKENLKDNE
ncbi:MAG: PilZ domain-containing protein [Candidatus Omnitrophica bacterium]|nr:PilZ domain-containing protein [Candidatus Omnitrophota bacterium]